MDEPYTAPPGIEELLADAPWRSLEEHLQTLRQRVDSALGRTHRMRRRYRDDLLASNEIASSIRHPSAEALERAVSLLATGAVAAADGTVAPVPLLGGSKIQVGIVVVSSKGHRLNFVTRVSECDLLTGEVDPRRFFSELRRARQFSNILSRAIMLHGERRLLLDEPADWRLIHGELVPYELRTGAGRPERNLPVVFDVAARFVRSEQFVAVSESPKDDIDLLNAAIVLSPGEYIVLRPLSADLLRFLHGDETAGTVRAHFVERDRRRFEAFVEEIGERVAVVLVKAGRRPFLIQCHRDRVEDAVALFLADSLWTRGHRLDGSPNAVRAFPFHIDLADQIAGTLFKSSEFQTFVENRLMTLGIDDGLFDLDPRRTRA